jgi:hypothetical protein
VDFGGRDRTFQPLVAAADQGEFKVLLAGVEQFFDGYLGHDGEIYGRCRIDSKKENITRKGPAASGPSLFERKLVLRLGL